MNEMVIVYQEMNNPKYAEIVAVFSDEDIYEACYPIIKKLAKKHHFDFVSESVEPFDIHELHELYEKESKFNEEKNKEK